MVLGGDCEFLEFPYGDAWRVHFGNVQYWMPFVKHCTISAFGQDGQDILILDGFNNEGFSGGPVVFKTGADRKIMGVVSGYHTEPIDVVFSSLAPRVRKEDVMRPPTTPAQPKGTVNTNSGFIIAYGISYATEAIKKNPIGPPRKPN